MLRSFRFLKSNLVPALLLLSPIPTLGSGSSRRVPVEGKEKTATGMFEVATIKPTNPSGKRLLGFMSYPGGRVVIGSTTVRLLIGYALDIQDFQIEGGPSWAASDRYDIAAVSPTRDQQGDPDLPSATPTAEQRKMILSLLTDRFGLKFHSSSKDGHVYFLVVSQTGPNLESTKHPDVDPRGGIGINFQGVPNGDAFGMNLSMSAFAQSISRELQTPVLDRTGLSGSYDFRTKAEDSNQGDAIEGILMALKPLGLKLGRGKGPIKTTFIDSLSRPTPN